VRRLVSQVRLEERAGSESPMTRDVALIGVPSGAGACGVGQHGTPAALRAAGLAERLADAGMAVSDLGDSPPWPWRPDRTNRRAQNLGAVVEQVRTTATRVADGLAVPVRIALVLGGDCTIGIGTVAGAQSVLGDIDLHADLNTPASAGDGALDWMALAHMLAIPDSEPSLAEATGRVPIIDPARVVLFGHGRAQATGWERNQIKRLDLARFAVEDVATDPEAVAEAALGLLASRAERYLIHLDVVDFTDAPISEHLPQHRAAARCDVPRIEGAGGRRWPCRNHRHRDQPEERRGRGRPARALRRIPGGGYRLGSTPLERGARIRT
jgi:arginase